MDGTAGMPLAFGNLENIRSSAVHAWEPNIARIETATRVIGHVLRGSA